MSSYLATLGVAYDSYTGDYYWSVEGGQGKIYISNSTRSFFRRNPFSLKLDWVARRLFWVEDGPTVRHVYGIDYGLSC